MVLAPPPAHQVLRVVAAFVHQPVAQASHHSIPWGQVNENDHLYVLASPLGPAREDYEEFINDNTNVDVAPQGAQDQFDARYNCTYNMKILVIKNEDAMKK